jgi:predicted nucleic acid-binding Zn ribbon protein
MSTTPTKQSDPKHADISAATIPDTTAMSVPAKQDYKNPVLSHAEEQLEHEREVAEANEAVRRKEGEQALEYYKQGITQGSESDIRVGMSHPTIGNRPGYSPDPVAPRFELSEKTLSEQAAGKEATPKLAEEQSAGKEAGKEAKKLEDKRADESSKPKG